MFFWLLFHSVVWMSYRTVYLVYNYWCVFYSLNWFNINICVTYLHGRYFCLTVSKFLEIVLCCQRTKNSRSNYQNFWNLAKYILFFIITEADENIKSFFLSNDAIPTSVNHLADYGDQKGLRHVMYLIALRHFIHSPKLRMTVTSPNTYLVPKSVVCVT